MIDIDKITKILLCIFHRKHVPEFFWYAIRFDSLITLKINIFQALGTRSALNLGFGSVWQPLSEVFQPNLEIRSHHHQSSWWLSYTSGKTYELHVFWTKMVGWCGLHSCIFPPKSLNNQKNLVILGPLLTWNLSNIASSTKMKTRVSSFFLAALTMIPLCHLQC